MSIFGFRRAASKVRSESSMLAGQRVLITKFDHDPSRAVGSARRKRCSWPIGAGQEEWLRAYPQATAAQAATLAPRPPFNARVETVTTKAILWRAVHPEWRTGGAVGRKIAAASRRDHLPCGPLQAARGLQRSGLC